MRDYVIKKKKYLLLHQPAAPMSTYLLEGRWLLHSCPTPSEILSVTTLLKARLDLRLRSPIYI